MGICAFCQEERTLTKEHVWPQWLADVLADETPQSFVRVAGGAVEDTWAQPMFKQTVRAVCANRNSGWMSQLEARAKPVLSPMIRGIALHLSADTQKLIATWALKTAIMAQCAAGEEITPVQDALWLYHDQEPPDRNVIVILARYGGRRHPLLLGHKPIWFGGPWPRQEAPEAYLTTVSVGQFVCQVVGTRVYLGESFTRRGWHADASQQIWPDPRSKTWPPAYSLSDEQLHVFASSVT